MNSTEKKIKLLVRIALGLVFVVSAAAKAAGPDRFLAEVGKLSFLAPSLDLCIGYGFIFFELVLGLLIIFKGGNRVLLTAGLTIFILSLYLAYKVIIRDTSDCGCFGNVMHRSNLNALIQDLLLLTGVVYLYEEKKS